MAKAGKVGREYIRHVGPRNKVVYFKTNGQIVEVILVKEDFF